MRYIVAQASLPAGSGGIPAARGSLSAILPASGFPGDRSALADQGFLDAYCALRVGFIQALQQTVGADFEELRHAGEDGNSERKAAPLIRTDGLKG